MHGEPFNCLAQQAGQHASPNAIYSASINNTSAAIAMAQHTPDSSGTAVEMTPRAPCKRTQLPNIASAHDRLSQRAAGVSPTNHVVLGALYAGDSPYEQANSDASTVGLLIQSITDSPIVKRARAIPGGQPVQRPSARRRLLRPEPSEPDCTLHADASVSVTASGSAPACLQLAVQGVKVKSILSPVCEGTATPRVGCAAGSGKTILADVASTPCTTQQQQQKQQGGQGDGEGRHTQARKSLNSMYFATHV